MEPVAVILCTSETGVLASFSHTSAFALRLCRWSHWLAKSCRALRRTLHCCCHERGDTQSCVRVYWVTSHWGLGIDC